MKSVNGLLRVAALMGAVIWTDDWISKRTACPPGRVSQASSIPCAPSGTRCPLHWEWTGRRYSWIAFLGVV